MSPEVLDLIVNIYKNWPDEPTVGLSSPLQKQVDDLCAHVQELLEQDEMELVENNYADLVEQGEIFALSSEDFGDE